jgi:hypothetical protein
MDALSASPTTSPAAPSSKQPYRLANVMARVPDTSQTEDAPVRHRLRQLPDCAIKLRPDLLTRGDDPSLRPLQQCWSGLQCTFQLDAFALDAPVNRIGINTTKTETGVEAKP